MKTDRDLRQLLREIDHKSYPAYKSLAGAWAFRDYTLVIDHVQGDPFASPSQLHVEIPVRKAGFPTVYLSSEAGRLALEDYLIRKVYASFNKISGKAQGSGKSGLIAITKSGQEVLKRSACEFRADQLILRFFVGFPAFGRSVNSKDLEKIFFEDLPSCISEALFYKNADKKAVEDAVYLSEDQMALRKEMKKRNLVAFVANGSVLPRKSGVSELPMKDAVLFQSPGSLSVTITLPHKGEINGMGIPAGVTLIVGGGYHGKSTLLEAIQNGVYNHIRGDGREYVLTDDTAVKVRAEDGRSIRNVDISLFINNLPSNKDTKCFSSEDASGSTSQAAAVIEAMEAGASVLLMDEDTSATNFMVRDDFMKQVISPDKEPITPFVDRVRALWEEAGISTILVAGSSGAFFSASDHVLMLDAYQVYDISDRVKRLCKKKGIKACEAERISLPDENRKLPAFHKKEEKRKNYRGTAVETVRRDHMKILLHV